MIWFGIFLALALTAAVYRARLRTTAVAFAAALFFFAVFGGSFGAFVLLSLLWLAVFVPLHVLPLRQEWISRPLLDRLPDPVADAPASAVVIGAQATALVRGVPDWSLSLSTPLPYLSVAERAFLDGPVEDFCRGLPRRESLAAAAVAVAYGGLGLSSFAQAAAVAKVASAPGRRFRTTARTLAEVFGAVRWIERQASPVQKQEWLALIARGLWVTVLPVPATAQVCHGLWKGREVEGWRFDFDGVSTPDAKAALIAVDTGAAPQAWVWLPSGTPGVAADFSSGREVFVPRSHGVMDADSLAPPAISDAARGAVALETDAARLTLSDVLPAERCLAAARLAERGADVYGREARRLCATESLGPVTPSGVTAVLLAAVPSVGALPQAQREPNPALALTRFDDALLDYAGHAAQTLARSLLLGVSGGRLLNPPTLGPLRGAHGRFSRYSADLALLTAVLPWTSTAQPQLAAHLGRVWDSLCTAAAVLRVFEAQGRREADTPFAQAALAMAARKIEDALDEAVHTIPSRAASLALRACVFPLGRSARPPHAQWQAAIVERLLNPLAPPLCALRFVSDECRRLQATVNLKRACADLESRLTDKRLRQKRRLDRIHEALGLGLIGPDAAVQLRELHNLTLACLLPVSDASQQNLTPQANLSAETEYEEQP